MPDKACKHIVISGSVQGVGYRYFASSKAKALGVCGFVKNLANGDVEVVAEGDALAVNDFVELLKQGPYSAQISDIKINEQPYSGKYQSFGIAF